MQKKQLPSGYSLIELLIVLAMIGILISLSIPNYSSYLTHGKRAEAKMTLGKLANALEHYYLINNTYKEVTLSELGFTEAIAHEGYQLSIVVTESDFILSAKPLGNQEKNDTTCGILTLNSVGEKQISGTGLINDCW